MRRAAPAYIGNLVKLIILQSNNQTEEVSGRQDKGSVMKKCLFTPLVAFFVPVFLLAFANKTLSGMPIVTNFMVTDVSPRSFSVIWETNEPSFADLLVFDDEEGFTVSESARIHPHFLRSGDISIRDAAENNGVMKVTVTGLLPHTTYYFQTVTTSKSTGEINRYPQSAPFPKVTTERVASRTFLSGEKKSAYSNDILVHECYLPDTVTPAVGTLLVVEERGKTRCLLLWVTGFLLLLPLLISTISSPSPSILQIMPP
jgi:hypothetical protein